MIRTVRGSASCGVVSKNCSRLPAARSAVESHDSKDIY
jgi:hypothetical protein